MFRVRTLPLTLALSLIATAGCSRPATGFLSRTYQAIDGRTYRYALFVPHDYAPQRPVPVILFLHGGGEAGTDGRRQTEVGLGPAVRARAATFPFLVVFPQARERVPATFGAWLPGQPDGERALAILDEVRKEYSTDAKRVYLTGISVGGFGTWQLAAAHPDWWAAIVPVCAVGPRTKVDALKRIPCWCFHGEADGNVPVDHSRDMVALLREAGGEPRYTEYLGVGHDSWDRAYATDELYEWLLRQRLP